MGKTIPDQILTQRAIQNKEYPDTNRRTIIGDQSRNAASRIKVVITMADEGVWKTIGGRRVFIKNGQSLSDAMRESGKFPSVRDFKPADERTVTAYAIQSDQVFKDFTYFERDSVKRYTNEAFASVNAYLNGTEKFNDQDSADNDKLINYLDSAVEQGNITSDLIVYRGTETKYYDNYKAGDTFTEKMYYSTSLIRDVAQEFCDEAPWRSQSEKNTVLEIQVPKGTRALYVGYHAGNNWDEREIILKRNTKFRVVSKENDKIVLGVVGDE